mmetsp:Transcript_35387/g.31852  ORF Transcript_35387/g.31852 Transcript_35387/m.31852 type:complete len:301 (+) Transcript_35387:40-942(+)
MKAIIFIAVLLLTANAFSFGKIGNAFKNFGNDVKHVATNAGDKIQHVATNAGDKIKHVATNAGNDIKHVATQAGQNIKNDASIFRHDVTKVANTFAQHIDSLPAEMQKEFKFVGAKVQTLAKNGEHVATEVAADIKKGAEAVAAEAEKLAPYLDIALECVEALLENAQIFLRFYEISEEPAQIILEWNPIADELFNICVACSGQSESKFEWLKEIKLQGKDIDIAMCAADLVDFAKSAVEVANIDDDIDPMVIIEFINSIIDMSDDCPSAIEYIEELADGSVSVTQKIADGFVGDSSDDI